MKVIIKPVLLGAITYVPLYGVLWAMYQLPENILQNIWVQLLATTYGLIMLPACGYVAARLSKQNGLLVGALAGSLVAVATVAISASLFGESWYGESVLITFLGFAVKYCFYSALGGGLGELHAQKGLVA